jgi:putative hydrolases of HD superfamily
LPNTATAPIDVLRVMKMLLIHDIVEIDAGDTFAYDTTRLADQHEREAAAATRIFGMLPDDQAAEFRALWDEFEDRETADARFAHAIDRCQAMLLNCLSEGVTWSRHNVRLDQIRARNAPIGEGASALWTHMSRLLDEAMQAGHITA